MIQITYPITKQELKKFRGLRLELVNQTERLERLRARIESCSPVLSDTPKGGGASDRLPDSISKLIELERVYQKQLNALENAVLRIEKAVLLVEDPFEREILRMRYVDCLDWDEIQILLRYEIRQVYRIHGKALLSIYKNTSCQ